MAGNPSHVASPDVGGGGDVGGSSGGNGAIVGSSTSMSPISSSIILSTSSVILSASDVDVELLPLYHYYRHKQWQMLPIGPPAVPNTVIIATIKIVNRGVLVIINRCKKYEMYLYREFLGVGCLDITLSIIFLIIEKT